MSSIGFDEAKHRGTVVVLVDLPRLTPHQCEIVQHRLPHVELVADLSWELRGTAVLRLRTPEL